MLKWLLPTPDDAILWTEALFKPVLAFDASSKGVKLRGARAFFGVLHSKDYYLNTFVLCCLVLVRHHFEGLLGLLALRGCVPGCLVVGPLKPTHKSLVRLGPQLLAC